jgi:hypothetical protein
VLNILSLRKAEDGGVAVVTLTDDNAVDGKIGSIGLSNYECVSTLVLPCIDFT